MNKAIQAARDLNSARTAEFHKSNQVGKFGENEFKQWVNSFKDLRIEDLSDDRQYQRAGTDFIVHNEVSGVATPTELKTDTYTSGNLFLETWVSGSAGWLHTSKAEVLAYYFPNLKGQPNLFLYNLQPLREWVALNSFREAGVKGLFGASGLLVPYSKANAATGVLRSSHTLQPVGHKVINPAMV